MDYKAISKTELELFDFQLEERIREIYIPDKNINWVEITEKLFKALWITVGMNLSMDRSSVKFSCLQHEIIKNLTLEREELLKCKKK